MPAKRSNKTARVLNLIATPSDTTMDEPSPAPHTTVNTEPKEPEKPKTKSRTSTAKRKSETKASDAPSATTADMSSTSSEMTEENIAAQTQSQQVPVLQPPVVPIVQTVREKEQQLVDDINSGLLQALSESEPPIQPSEPSIPEEPRPSSADDPVADADSSEQSSEIPQQTSPSSSPEPLATISPEPDQVGTIPQESSPPEQSNATSPESKSNPSKEIYTPIGDQDVDYTNVLQELVEQSAPYYIDNMLQCHCKRCIADMKALALTNLPSKYVVLEKSKRIAFMSFYEAKYDKVLSVQMMRACVIVNEHPHH